MENINNAAKVLKRILFIITGLVGGGAEKALTNLLQAMDKEKYSVDVLVVFEDKLCDCKAEGVTYHTLFKSRSSLLYRIAKHLYLRLHNSTLLRCCTRCKIRNDYDIVVSFLEGDSLLYHSYLFDKASVNISWVHTDFVENHWSVRHFAGDDERKAYNALDKAVFVSEYIREQFQKVFPLPQKIKQYVCPNIVNEAEVLRKSEDMSVAITKRKFTVCSVGRLEEVKGYDMVIGAAQILKRRNRDVDFWIIGSGSQEEQLVAQLHQSDCSESVHFLGYKENPYPYMLRADVVLSSSRAEGLPLVLVEALFLGKPIVATKTKGALAILGNGTFGKVIDITPKAIADAVEEMLSIEHLRHYQAMSIAGKKQFDTNRILKQITEILE